MPSSSILFYRTDLKKESAVQDDTNANVQCKIGHDDCRPLNSFDKSSLISRRGLSSTDPIIDGRSRKHSPGPHFFQTTNAADTRRVCPELGMSHFHGIPMLKNKRIRERYSNKFWTSTIEESSQITAPSTHKPNAEQTNMKEQSISPLSQSQPSNETLLSALSMLHATQTSVRAPAPRQTPAERQRRMQQIRLILNSALEILDDADDF